MLFCFYFSKDDEVKGFLRSYARLDDRKYEKQRVRKALKEKNLLTLISQTSLVAAAAAGAGAVMGYVRPATTTAPNTEEVGIEESDEEDIEEEEAILNMVIEETEPELENLMEDGDVCSYLADPTSPIPNRFVIPKIQTISQTNSEEETRQNYEDENNLYRELPNTTGSHDNDFTQVVILPPLDTDQCFPDPDSGMCSANIQDEHTPTSTSSNPPHSKPQWGAGRAWLAQPDPSLSLDQDCDDTQQVRPDLDQQGDEGKQQPGSTSSPSPRSNPASSTSARNLELFVSLENEEDYLENNVPVEDYTLIDDRLVDM